MRCWRRVGFDRLVVAGLRPAPYVKFRLAVVMEPSRSSSAAAAPSRPESFRPVGLKSHRHVLRCLPAALRAAGLHRRRRAKPGMRPFKLRDPEADAWPITSGRRSPVFAMRPGKAGCRSPFAFGSVGDHDGEEQDRGYDWRVEIDGETDKVECDEARNYTCRVPPTYTVRGRSARVAGSRKRNIDSCSGVRGGRVTMHRTTPQPVPATASTLDPSSQRFRGRFCMAFHSVTRFICDLCGETSPAVEVQSDMVRCSPPTGWTRIDMETNREIIQASTDPDWLRQQLGLDERVSKHACAHCTPVVEKFFTITSALAIRP